MVVSPLAVPVPAGRSAADVPLAAADGPLEAPALVGCLAVGLPETPVPVGRSAVDVPPEALAPAARSVAVGP